MAEQVGSNKSMWISCFALLFKERTGVAPVKFLETRRIEKARHILLTTDLPVQQVGLQAGFPRWKETAGTRQQRRFPDGPDRGAGAR